MHRHYRIAVESVCMAAILLGLLGRRGESSEPEDARFSFGVIADIQHADKANVGTRHYRESLDLLKKCVADLGQRKLSFVIELGDIVDGNETLDRTQADLNRVLSVLDPLAGKLHHVLGNHCMNAGREYVLKRYGLERGYYDFVPQGIKGWRMVVLDGNDAGYGVIGREQLDWLRRTLARAEAQGERVLLFCHFAVAQEAAAHHRLNQPEPLKQILAESPCVVAYLAGHDHQGGYAEKDGLYHVTVQAMVDASAKNAFGVVHVYDDRLVLEGIGDVPSRTMKLRAAAQKKAG